MQNTINHVAIIMDGNARWAKANGKENSEGHEAGVQAAKALLPHVSELGIKYLTLYAFSSENWQRPKKEVSTLINLLYSYTSSEISLLNKHNLRLKVIGDLTKLSSTLQNQIKKAVKATENNDAATICIAFSYGARAEIVEAARRMIENNERDIDEAKFQSYLYDPEMPDVDLFIRTSGVYRISNFLLWQSSYAELYFIQKYWPDFTAQDLKEAVEEYGRRSRRFGKRI